MFSWAGWQAWAIGQRRGIWMPWTIWRQITARHNVYAIHLSWFSQNCLKPRLADIRADHITVGLGQAPTECYVLVQFDGTKRRSKSKPVGLEKATEWKEVILLWGFSSCYLLVSVDDFQPIWTIFYAPPLNLRLFWVCFRGDRWQDTAHAGTQCGRFARSQWTRTV